MSRILPRRQITKIISITLMCLFVVKQIGGMDLYAESSFRQEISALAPESSLHPFFKRHSLDLNNVAVVLYATKKLKELVGSGRLRESHIVKLNRLFPDNNIVIDEDIRSNALRSGHSYKAVVFDFKNENKRIKVCFAKDYKNFSDSDFEELGIMTEEDRKCVFSFEREGVWFAEASPSRPITFEEMRKRFMWVPLVSFGGVNYFNKEKSKNYTVADLATDPDKQFEIIEYIQEELKLNIVFTMMDLSSWPEAVYEANKHAGALPISSVFAESHADQKGALFGEGFAYTRENIAKLEIPDPYKHGRRGVFFETIRKLKKRYNHSVAKIGYVIAPFTLATRLRNNAEEILMDIRFDEETFQDLLEYCTTVAISQVEVLADSGADTVIVLDPQTALIELLGPADIYFRQNITGPVNKVAEAAHNKGLGVIFHGCGDSTPYLEYMPELDVEAFSIDEIVDMQKAYDVLTKNGTFLIGNIKASQMAQRTRGQLKEETLSLMRRFGLLENFIPGITCEMPFDATMDHVMAIIHGLLEYQMSALEPPVDAGPAETKQVLLLKEKYVNQVKREINRTHKENLQYTPDIPEKAILCHIVSDSILPDGQQGILKRLEPAMRDRDDCREKVVCLSVPDGGEFMRELGSVKERLEKLYRDKGYTVLFDVACPDQNMVSEIQKTGVPALAFTQGGKGEMMQVEGIILALRALQTGNIDKLLSVYKFLTDDRVEVRFKDINELARNMLFILPVEKMNINMMSKINAIIEENIKTAA